MTRIIILALATLAVALPAQAAPTRDCPKGYIQDRQPPFKCVRGYRFGPHPGPAVNVSTFEEDEPSAFEQEIERQLDRIERERRKR